VWLDSTRLCWCLRTAVAAIVSKPQSHCRIFVSLTRLDWTRLDSVGVYAPLIEKEEKTMAQGDKERLESSKILMCNRNYFLFLKEFSPPRVLRLYSNTTSCNCRTELCNETVMLHTCKGPSVRRWSKKNAMHVQINLKTNSSLKHFVGWFVIVKMSVMRESYGKRNQIYWPRFLQVVEGTRFQCRHKRPDVYRISFEKLKYVNTESCSVPRKPDPQGPTWKGKFLVPVYNIDTISIKYGYNIDTDKYTRVFDVV
jgi:hypothetical protein